MNLLSQLRSHKIVFWVKLAYKLLESTRFLKDFIEDFTEGLDLADSQVLIGIIEYLFDPIEEVLGSL